MPPSSITSSRDCAIRRSLGTPDSNGTVVWMGQDAHELTYTCPECQQSGRELEPVKGSWFPSITTPLPPPHAALCSVSALHEPPGMQPVALFLNCHLVRCLHRQQPSKATSYLKNTHHLRYVALRAWLHAEVITRINLRIYRETL